MKLCVAQTRPVKGDISANITHHKKIIDLAIGIGADTIIFPELSITGYEPELAHVLATDKDDAQFTVFQQISDAKNITIGIGVPTKSFSGISITMVLFQPNKPRETYSKRYLHSSEEPFFVRGKSSVETIGAAKNIALAICYEISVPEHAANASKLGADIYIASIVEDGVDKALVKLSNIAQKYKMTVLMANCVGQSGAYLCEGKTSIFNNQGALLGQLDGDNEGILMIDMATQTVVSKYISASEQAMALKK